MDWDTDRLVRTAAMRWLDDAGRRHANGAIPHKDTMFAVPELGQKFRALSPAYGIWKPKVMKACLSVLTSSKNAYEDGFSEDGRLINYSYRESGGYDHSDNRSLRLAMEHRLPILQFWALAVGLYRVEVVLVVGEEPSGAGVHIQVLPEAMRMVNDQATQIVAEPSALDMGYRTASTRIRVHQGEFRYRVMGAYHKKCAVCRLKRESLLDAAHIIPDSQGGRPETSNGLALCRIHHGAYDQNILGIDPDYRIHINQDMLQERDGPMLEHGFKKMEAQIIHHPRLPKNRPDRNKLQQRYEDFLSV